MPTHPPRSSLLRTTLVCLLASVPVTACGGDGDVPNEAPIGNVERTGSITAANLAIVVDGSGGGVLVGTLVNDGEEADRLVDVQVVDEEGVEVPVEIEGGGVELPVDEAVQLAEAPLVVLSSDALRPGFRPELTLEFEVAPPIVDTASVEPATGPYAGVEVPEVALSR